MPTESQPTSPAPGEFYASVHDAINDMPLPPEATNDADNAPAPAPQEQQAPAEQTDENVSTSKPDPQDEAAAPDDEQHAADDADADADDADESDDLDDNLITADETHERYVEAPDGSKVSVAELMNERMMRSRFTQGMQELSEQRKQFEHQGQEQSHLAAGVIQGFAGIVQHYQQYANQLDPNARQILQQMSEAVNAAQQTKQQWAGDYQKAVDEARQLEAKESVKRLQGYVPGWDDTVYRQVMEFYAEQFGTPVAKIADIIDPGMMAGLYQGMKHVQATKRVAKARKGNVRPRSRAPRPQQTPANQGTQATTRQQLSQKLDAVNDVDSAIDFLLSERNANG